MQSAQLTQRIHAGERPVRLRVSHLAYQHGTMDSPVKINSCLQIFEKKIIELRQLESQPFFADLQRSIVEHRGFATRRRQGVRPNDLSDILQQLQESRETEAARDYLGLNVRRIQFNERSSQTQQARPLIYVKRKSLAGRQGEEGLAKKLLPLTVKISERKSANSTVERQMTISKSLISDSAHRIYENKLASFRQFLMQMRFCSGLLTQPVFLPEEEARATPKLRAYVGKGNNSNLVKCLVKRRYWWALTQNIAQADFVWTQLKDAKVFGKQVALPLPPQTKPADNKGEVKIRKVRRLRQKQQSTRQFLYKIFTSRDQEDYGGGFQQLSLEERAKRLNRVRGVSEYRGAVMHNHLPKNYCLGNKKALFYTLKAYYQEKRVDPFQTIPLTFHLTAGTTNRQYKRFLAEFRKGQRSARQSESSEGEEAAVKNMWILKPGENSNRGQGIEVFEELHELGWMLKAGSRGADGKPHTYIVQKYLERPLLYQGRKFDIRHYFLVARLNGRTRAYWTQEGYIRTSSREYSLETDDRLVHLTNDAVQKCSPEYGRFQPGNKLSYHEFQRYLDAKYPKKGWDFARQALPRMRQAAEDAVRANWRRMNPDRLEPNFELFGMDFMLDRTLKPWLIEINTNPCLELPCALLARLIPSVLEHALRLTLDVLHPPPGHYPYLSRHFVPDRTLQKSPFELMFDEARDGEGAEPRGDRLELEEDEDQTYEDEGQQLTDQMMV